VDGVGAVDEEEDALVLADVDVNGLLVGLEVVMLAGGPC
jgi:hypothetical protein